MGSRVNHLSVTLAPAPPFSSSPSPLIAENALFRPPRLGRSITLCKTHVSSPPPPSSPSPSSSFSSQPSLCTSLAPVLPPSAAPSIYKRSRSEFLKRHFHVPCVSLSPSPPPPHFPILRTSGELSDDKSSKSSILPLESSSAPSSSSSSLSFALLLPL